MDGGAVAVVAALAGIVVVVEDGTHGGVVEAAETQLDLFRRVGGRGQKAGCHQGGSAEKNVLHQCVSLILRNGRRPNRLSTRSEEHTSELQSLMRISYAVFCLKKKTTQTQDQT